jgi:hypothetical protein
MTATLATLVSVLCMTLTGGLGLLFALNPARGMAAASHHAPQLPLVMSDRYIGTAFLLLGVLLWGDLWLLAWFMGVVGIAGFGDVMIYRRAGRPVGPHLAAAILYLVAAALALSAQLANGTP